MDYVVLFGGFVGDQKSLDLAYQAAQDFADWAEANDPGGSGGLSVVFPVTQSHIINFP